MAARVNKKRAFLFVSKVLGKHIPVHPVKPLLVSGLLAMAYAKEQTGKTPPHQDLIVEALKTDDHKVLTAAYETLKKKSFQLAMSLSSSALRKRQQPLDMVCMM